jgi:hypothetical protein
MTGSPQTTDCLKSLGPYFTGVVALLIALFGEYMRRLTFKPRLNVSASSDSPHCLRNTYYSLGENSVERPHYSLRIAIENSGNAEAKNVEVFVKDLQRQKGRGNFEPVEDFLGTYLNWSGLGTQVLDVLNPGMPKYCYLARVFWKENLPTSYYSDISPPREDYLGDRTVLHFAAPPGSGRKQHFGPGNYLLTVRVGAANAKPAEKVLKINITGRWPGTQSQRVTDVLEFGMHSPGIGEVVNGGNARVRRGMRRILHSFSETYGYPQRRKAGPTGKSQSFWDFVLKYFVPVVGLIAFGLKVGESTAVVASASYILALAVFLRGFWAWCDTRRKTVGLLIASGIAVVAFGWCDYRWIREEWTPTFLYLVPTPALIDCEKRAFFVNHSGFKGLQNIKIIIKDNKSGSVRNFDDYRNGIEPGPQNPDAPRYIWVKPSHPWDEDYTVTITGTKYRSVQEMVIRSIKQSVQFAVQITVDPKKRPLVNCRDDLLPETSPLGTRSQENCNTLMTFDPTFLSKLQPEFHGFQKPNGDFTVVRLRELPPTSDLESQSEDRHLTEYQQTVMRAKLSKYQGSKLLILSTGGPKTLAFANGFRDFFRSIRWLVDGPRPVPVGDERLVDVQMSVSKRYWSSPYPRAADFLSSLEGIKHRQKYIYDDAISPDLIVVWIGPKSPDNFRPDDCAPAALRPTPGEPHTCESIAQTTGLCPFVPK